MVADPDKTTTIKVKGKHLDLMDMAAQNLYGCQGVSRMTVLEQLLSDHPDIPEWIVGNSSKRIVADGGSTSQANLNGVNAD